MASGFGVSVSGFKITGIGFHDLDEKLWGWLAGYESGEQGFR